MSTSGSSGASASGGGVATTQAPQTFTNAGTVIPGLALALPASMIPSSIDIEVDLPWCIAGAAAGFVAVAILEDGVVLNESTQQYPAANANFGVRVRKLGYVPAAGGHTYTVKCSSGATSGQVFGESIAPVVESSLIVKAAA